MAERTPEELCRIFFEQSLNIKYEELSDEEPDREEEFDEVEDLQDADEDTSLDDSACRNLIDPENAGDDNARSQPGRRRSIVKGRNNYKWSTTPPKTRARSPFSPDNCFPRAIGEAKNVKTPLEAWSLLFPPDLLEIVVERTNEEIRRRGNERVQSHCQETNVVELKALLGLLYFSGLERHNNTCSDDLWSPQLGNNVYRAVMQKHRFHYLSACLRFDDKTTRAERRAAHGLAPIKDIWDIFISNCAKYYSPSTYCTIDEQILRFRGRFGARVYVPDKPDKYGIKIVSMNDVQTSYLISAEPYVGGVTTADDESAPSYYVRKLSESIHRTERNITCDNWFMSVGLAERMKKMYGLTVVGAMRKNKLEIPSSFARTTTAGTVRYAYAEGNTLVSWCPERNKVVLLLSSLHEIGRMDDETGKPEIVAFYNRTKGGTDTFDRLCHAYTAARGTLRWPQRLFFGMLDQAGINSAILYNLPTTNAALSRRNFIKELIYALIQPQLQLRLRLPTLRTSLRVIILDMLQIDSEPTERTSKLRKRKRCSFCSTDKKTSYCCVRCEKPICEEHRLCLCTACIDGI